MTFYFFQTANIHKTLIAPFSTTLPPMQRQNHQLRPGAPPDVVLAHQAGDRLRVLLQGFRHQLEILASQVAVGIVQRHERRPRAAVEADGVGVRPGGLDDVLPVRYLLNGPDPIPELWHPPADGGGSHACRQDCESRGRRDCRPRKREGLL